MGYFPTGGGLPIWAGKQIIGFIGVGGQAPRDGWSDEMCAWQALNQVVGQQPRLAAGASASAARRELIFRGTVQKPCAGTRAGLLLFTWQPPVFISRASARHRGGCKCVSPGFPWVPC